MIILRTFAPYILYREFEYLFGFKTITIRQKNNRK